ncbi:MAG: signal recognition particle protein [Actinomycetota bacterium]|nr:signal recognition particle protein [Actinomycetota bacterium]
MFAQLSNRISSALRDVRGKGRLTETDVDDALIEIRAALLEADVALSVVREFAKAIKARAIGAEVSAALNPGQQFVRIVNEELTLILGSNTRSIKFATNKPTVIMLLGLQGAGKTTLAGKLATWLKAQDRTPLLVAADLQRPNAVDQLKVIAEQANVAIYAPEPGNGIGDPVAVAVAALKHAAGRNDVIIIDTAGRLAIDADLIKQAAEMKKAVQPTETLFVVDAMIGQDAVLTAQQFDQEIGFDATVLTKLDGDARGGAALSLVSVTGKPIMFASTGEKLTDFDYFHPDRMASRILDQGDVLTLIEKAEKAFDAEQSTKMAQSLKSGDGFTLEDFLEQLQAVQKMGDLSSMLAMLPGAGKLKNQLTELDDRQLKRTEAIIQSMTPTERAEPELLNGSRRARIAAGSGTSVAEINTLVKRFSEAQKMLKRGSIPGIGPIPGAPRAQGKKVKSGKGARRSGNPAKRAQQG